MLHRLMWVLVGGIAAFSAPVRSEMSGPHMQGPTTERIDISAHAVLGNRLAECRMTGDVILWVSRSVEILDDTRVSLGAIEAGLVQFGTGSKLKGCVPDGDTLDLSGLFANFLVADERSLRSGAISRPQAAVSASQLAQDFYQLAEHEGALIPLVDGIARAIGPASYRFKVVLIRDAKSGSFDAVIHRETLGTELASPLIETDRRLSRLKWSSLP